MRSSSGTESPSSGRASRVPTLLLLILEQQVAGLGEGGVTVDARVGGVTPERLLTLSDVELREDGFSRQKTRYARALSEALLDGSLDLEALCSLDDAGVRETLVALPGSAPGPPRCILSALRRPDTWPIGDIALQEAARRALDIDARPSAVELELIESAGGHSAPPRRACSGTSTSPSADAAER